MKTSRHAYMLIVFLLPPASAYADCVSCQIHKQGGSYIGSYAVPKYQTNRYYGNRYPNYGYGSYPGYGQGSLKHRCGPDGNCATTYRGPASDINNLPRIDRQIRQTRPSRMYINPQPKAVPLR